MCLLEAADDDLGVACLGGECFGDAGHGFIRFSVAQDTDRLQAAVDFMEKAVHYVDRVEAFLRERDGFRLQEPYNE